MEAERVFGKEEAGYMDKKGYSGRAKVNWQAGVDAERSKDD